MGRTYGHVLDREGNAHFATTITAVRELPKVAKLVSDPAAKPEPKAEPKLKTRGIKIALWVISILGAALFFVTAVLIVQLAMAMRARDAEISQALGRIERMTYSLDRAAEKTNAIADDVVNLKHQSRVFSQRIEANDRLLQGIAELAAGN